RSLAPNTRLHEAAVNAVATAPILIKRRRVSACLCGPCSLFMGMGPVTDKSSARATEKTFPFANTTVAADVRRRNSSCCGHLPPHVGGYVVELPLRARILTLL